MNPIIVVDNREQRPLPFSHLQCVRATLQSGDYSIADCEELFAVERKTVSDLVSCCTTEGNRFERELRRLRGFRFKRLLIIGSEEEIAAGNFRALVSPKVVLSSLGCFEVRYDLPVIFCATPELAANQIEKWAIWFARELRKNAALLETSVANTAIIVLPSFASLMVRAGPLSKLTAKRFRDLLAPHNWLAGRPRPR